MIKLKPYYMFGNWGGTGSKIKLRRGTGPVKAQAWQLQFFRSMISKPNQHSNIKQMLNLEEQIWNLAETSKHDSRELLGLLRSLESLHRKICYELFEPSLPDTRQALYQLLHEIEEQGGWPYIERMKLQSLLANLETLEEPPNF